MQIQRNDPCHCGSGRKYKRCHMEEDQAAERSARLLHLVRDADAPASSARTRHPPATPPGSRIATPNDRPGATRARRSDLADADIGAAWQADLIPYPIEITDDPGARPIIAAVVSGRIALNMEPINHPPPEIPQLAEVLADAVRAAIRAAQVTPSSIAVRQRALARALAPLLEPDGITVKASSKLGFVDRAIDALLAFTFPDDDFPPGSKPPPSGPHVSRPAMWAGWHLDRKQIARFFSAAAAFFRATPWKHMHDMHALTVTVPGGSSWTVTMMGNAAEEYGLVMYELREDLDNTLGGGDAREIVRNFKGAVISVSFDPKNELPRPMVREIRDAHWEVAEGDAWPNIIPYNTIGGGITSRTMEDLIALLPAVARFATRYEEELSREEDVPLPLTLDDSESGVRVELEELTSAHPAAIGPPPRELSPGNATGSGADPMAWIGAGDFEEEAATLATEIVAEFEDYLRSGASGRTLGESTIRDDMMMAEHFVFHFLQGYEESAIESVNELDLRIFLYDWLLRKTMMTEAQLVKSLGSLRRFFDYLAVEWDIVCPWAAPVLKDKATFVRRLRSKPHGLPYDDEVMLWQYALYHDLDLRAFLPDLGDAETEDEEPMIGPAESGLRNLVQKLWLLWRDEIITSGERDPGKVRAELLARQRMFEQTPLSSDERSPAELIRAEREQLAKELAE
jgi:hypothetical protein